MSQIKSILVVQNSLEDTFAFLNTPKSHLKFIPRCVEFTQTSEGAFGQVGATVRGVVRYFGVRIPINYKIVEHQMNHRLAMHGKMGPVSFNDGYILSKTYNGTEIKFWLELNPTGWAKVFFPFAGLIGKVHAWETLRNLKREMSEIGG